MFVHQVGAGPLNPFAVHVPLLSHAAAGFDLGMAHLWSLCVEEQFYLIWPLLVWLMPSRKSLMWLAGLLAPTIVVLRCYFYLTDTAMSQQSAWLYYMSYTGCDELLIGAWIALWLREAAISRTDLRRISLWLFLISSTALVGALAAVSLHFHHLMAPNPENPAMQTAGFTLLGLSAAAILLRSLDEQSRLHRMLKWPWLRHLGRISYGFYVYHALPVDLFAKFTSRYLSGYTALLILPIAFAYSYAAAWLSFRFLESPFLKLKTILALAAHPSIPKGTENYLASASGPG